MDQVQKIAIFPGSFNPVHEGQVLFAEAAADNYGFDEVVFVLEAAMVDSKKRASMLNVALADHPKLTGMLLQAEEADAFGLVEEVVAAKGRAEYTLLLGSGEFEQLINSGEAMHIAEGANLVVGLRYEDDGEIVIPLAKTHELEASYFPAPAGSVSAASIRADLAAGQAAKGLSDEVAKFIELTKLY